MSAKEQFYKPLEEHETLSIETLENGELRIKFYSYKKYVNPLNFVASLKKIEESLNKDGYYLEGRPNQDPKAKKPDKVSGEISDKSTSAKPLITAKSDNLTAAVDQYKAEHERLKESGSGKDQTS
jgi:hypothetical protein